MTVRDRDRRTCGHPWYDLAEQRNNEINQWNQSIGCCRGRHDANRDSKMPNGQNQECAQRLHAQTSKESLTILQQMCVTCPSTLQQGERDEPGSPATFAEESGHRWQNLNFAAPVVPNRRRKGGPDWQTAAKKNCKLISNKFVCFFSQVVCIYF